MSQLVSVCLITYDRPELLEEAIECFLKQTYQNKELIIVNDRPEQKLVFNHPRVKIHNLQERFTCCGDKRKFSASLAQGEYIQFWDDDDIHLPWHIDDCITRLQYFTKPVSRANYYWNNFNGHHYVLKYSGWVHTLHIHRDLYKLSGGHKSITRNEDIDFIKTLLTKKLLSHYRIPPMEPSFIYNVVTGRSQITRCIEGNEDQHELRWQKVKDEADLRNLCGTINLVPHWKHDYVQKSHDSWSKVK